MRRTTVSLPDDVARIAEREARRRETSLSELVRQALVEHLHLAPGTPRALPFADLGHSGHRTTARDAEAVLDQDWAEDIMRDRGR